MPNLMLHVRLSLPVFVKQVLLFIGFTQCCKSKNDCSKALCLTTLFINEFEQSK